MSRSACACGRTPRSRRRRGSRGRPPCRRLGALRRLVVLGPARRRRRGRTRPRGRSGRLGGAITPPILRCGAHEGPRHGRRRLHRLGRRPAAARRRPRGRRARRPLARPRAPPSRRAPSSSRPTCSTGRARDALAEGSTASCTSPRSRWSPSRSSTPSATGATTSSARSTCSTRCARTASAGSCSPPPARDLRRAGDGPDRRGRPDRAGQRLRRLQARRRPDDRATSAARTGSPPPRCATSTSPARAATSARTTSPRRT